jgi:hypothetical protein
LLLTGASWYNKGVKRSGFKRPSYDEYVKKQRQKQARKLTASKTVKKPAIKKKQVPGKTKYPSHAGVRNSRRWVGYKGAFWAIFSMYTRKRDFLRYGGRCVSCPRILEDWRDGDAGHYVSVSRGGIDLCFDEDNVHLQCKRCNNPAWTVDAGLPFGMEVDRRLGDGVARKLLERSFKETGKEPSQDEYKRLVEIYKDKFDAL